MNKTPRIIFFGTSTYAVAALRWLVEQSLGPALVITQPDKPTGRGHSLTAPVIKKVALELGLTVIQPPSLKESELRQQLGTEPWTVGVVASYGRIIPSWLLTLPEKGLVNLHPSLLPRYRGASPIQTTIANGDLETGNTLMMLDAGMDTGPIIGQMRIPVSLRETSLSLEKKLADAVPALLNEHLLPYLTGTRTPQPQAVEEQSVTPLLTRADGKINWRDSADRIERLARAYYPWPGIWTMWQGQVLKLIAVQKKNTQGLAPAQVAWKDNELLIGCGTDALLITHLQLQGKKPLEAAAFVNGHAAFPGSYVG